MSSRQRFPLLSPIVSVTHAHLVLAAAAELALRPSLDPVRVLDVGCGNGNLLSAVVRFLPTLIGREVDALGFDVSDVAVQQRGFFSKTMQTLQASAPEIDWTERLTLLTSTEPWPAADGTIDLVITNQVVEHVRDINRFMSELNRVLSSNGVAINLFPTKASIVEGHVGVPWAHRVRSNDLRKEYLGLAARGGLARFGPLRMDGVLDWNEWAEDRSNYLHSSVWYRTWSEISDAAKRAGLQSSYRWTLEFYLLKLGYLGGGDRFVRYHCGVRRRAMIDFLAFRILQRIASVTVVLEKVVGYNPGETVPT